MSCKAAERFWVEDDGFLVSIELILISTISVIGLIAGLSSVRDAVVSELSDVAGAVQDLNQCYSFFGVVGHASSTCGSDFVDNFDFCDDADDALGAADNCITFEGTSDVGDGADAGGGATGIGTGVVIVRPPIIVRP